MAGSLHSFTGLVVDMNPSEHSPLRNYLAGYVFSLILVLRWASWRDAFVPWNASIPWTLTLYPINTCYTPSQASQHGSAQVLIRWCCLMKEYDSMPSSWLWTL